ncbi:MAG TPA: MFS transporter, partial [Steroidobacteraceae bacterium]|nr:MFS transporter [Steroidobacteraceae bacterium]
MQIQPIQYSAAYKRVVTLLLMTAYTFNSMDRSIISIIASAMKIDLELTDTELGLLGGTAFAMLYAFGGIPMARLAERISRVNIIAIALIVWSSLTALCGVAATFTQLLLIRMGVGVAEAGCSPAAHSLLSDYFAPSRRTSALSIYSCGISLGYILAAVVGGYVAQHLGWRIACAAVGLPGVASAVLIKVLVREPPRGYSDSAAAAAAAAAAKRTVSPFSMRTELRELRAVAAALLLDRPILHMVLGVTVGAFAAYGFYAFVPAYFSRAFALSYAAIGIIAALAGGLAVGIGIAAGGFIADFLARRDARWYAWVPAAGGAVPP